MARPLLAGYACQDRSDRAHSGIRRRARARHRPASGQGAGPARLRGAHSDVHEPRKSPRMVRDVCARFRPPRGDRRRRDDQRRRRRFGEVVDSLRAGSERIREHVRPGLWLREPDAPGDRALRARAGPPGGRGPVLRRPAVSLPSKLRAPERDSGSGGAGTRTAQGPPVAPSRLLRRSVPVSVQRSPLAHSSRGGRCGSRRGGGPRHRGQRRDVSGLPEPHAHRLAHRRALRCLRDLQPLEARPVDAGLAATRRLAPGCQ